MKLMGKSAKIDLYLMNFIFRMVWQMEVLCRHWIYTSL